MNTLQLCKFQGIIHLVATCDLLQHRHCLCYVWGQNFVCVVFCFSFLLLLLVQNRERGSVRVEILSDSDRGSDLLPYSFPFLPPIHRLQLHIIQFCCTDNFCLQNFVAGLSVFLHMYVFSFFYLLNNGFVLLIKFSP